MRTKKKEELIYFSSSFKICKLVVSFDWICGSEYLFFFSKRKMLSLMYCLGNSLYCKHLVSSQKSIFLNALAGAHFFSNLIFLLSFSLSLSKERVAGEREGGKEERGKRRVFSNKNISLFGGQKEDFTEIYIYISVGFFLFDISTNKWKRGLQVFYIHQKNLEQNKITPERESNL